MMDSDNPFVAAPPDWKDEFEQLVASAPPIEIGTSKPYRERSIKLEAAEHFVSFLFGTDEVLDAAIKQGRWAQEWSERPGSDSQVPKEAHDYPLALFYLMSKFRNWFELKYKIDDGGGIFLQEIQSNMIGLFFEEGSRPSSERIREKLLAMKFVKSGE